MKVWLSQKITLLREPSFLLYLQRGCDEYAKRLPRIFASDSKYFSDAQFFLELQENAELILNSSVERKLRSKKSELLSFS